MRTNLGTIFSSGDNNRHRMDAYKKYYSTLKNTF